MLQGSEGMPEEASLATVRAVIAMAPTAITMALTAITAIDHDRMEYISTAIPHFHVVLLHVPSSTRVSSTSILPIVPAPTPTLLPY
jgi:hypothetical protein